MFCQDSNHVLPCFAQLQCDSFHGFMVFWDIVTSRTKTTDSVMHFNILLGSVSLDPFVVRDLAAIVHSISVNNLDLHIVAQRGPRVVESTSCVPTLKIN